jgi:hypothetical protein
MTPEFNDVFQPVYRPLTHLGLGPLDCWIKRSAHDWSIAIRRDPEQQVRWVRDEAAPERSEELVWQRFPVDKRTARLRIKPCFPARPVVIRPDAPYRILPGDKVQFFMSVPLGLRIMTDEAQPVVLLQEPSMILSNTWFGDHAEGELAFSLRTSARRSVEELDDRRYRITCPVRMKNVSGELFSFERFCLRVSCLNMYRGAARFWANEIGVTYKGPDHISRVAYTDKAPRMGREAELIVRAEQSADHFSLRSFYSGIFNL